MLQPYLESAIALYDYYYCINDEEIARIFPFSWGSRNGHNGLN